MFELADIFESGTCKPESGNDLDKYRVAVRKNMIPYRKIVRK